MEVLYINDKFIDLEGDTNIKITQQVNDIAELDKRQDTYTNTIKVPRTSNNIKNLDCLSLQGDLSRLPYKKNTCVYIRDGVTLINKGWAIIKSTSTHYSIYIYEGVRDLFKDIENKTLGSYLDLTEINHNKNMNKVINSFNTNSNYCYLIADYNGKTHVNQKINIDYLVPSARVSFLWQKIQDKTGWLFVGEIFYNERFKNLWLTYPNPLIKDDQETSIKAFKAARGEYRGYYNEVGTIPNEEMFKDAGYKNWNVSFETVPEETENVDNWSIKVLKDGSFKFNITLAGYIQHTTKIYVSQANWGGNHTISIYALSEIQLLVYVNGVLQDEDNLISNLNMEDAYHPVVLEDLKAGSVISFSLKAYTGGDKKVQRYNERPGESKFTGSSLYLRNLSIDAFRLDAGTADFSKALSDFRITDFFKEILCMFGLTVYIDKYDKIAYFLTMAERLTRAKVYDFTDYYLEREKEQYQLSTYAQNNRMKYKYNDEESDYNDGIIEIVDDNLTDEKTVIESQIFSPERDNVEFIINPNNQRILKVYPIWEKEPNENNGILEIKYKGLSKRFYWLRKKEENIANVLFTSEILLEERGYSGIVPLADYNRLPFQDIIKDNYSETAQILNDVRIHSINLNLPLPLVSNFDMKGLFYFQQEGQYYFPNKLNYSKNKLQGEFVRVKYEVEDYTITPKVGTFTPYPLTGEFKCVSADVIPITDYNFEIAVAYTSGNGVAYTRVEFSSTEDSDFKAILEEGILNLGSGTLFFTLSGNIPAKSGVRTFDFTLFGVPLSLEFGFTVELLTKSKDSEILLEDVEEYTFKETDFPFVDEQEEHLELIRFTDIQLYEGAQLTYDDIEVEVDQEISIANISRLKYISPREGVDISSLCKWQGKTETGCWSKDSEIKLLEKISSPIYYGSSESNITNDCSMDSTRKTLLSFNSSVVKGDPYKLGFALLYKGAKPKILLITEITGVVLEYIGNSTITHTDTIISKIIGENGEEATLPLSIPITDNSMSDIGYYLINEGTYKCPEAPQSYTRKLVNVYFKVQDSNGVWGPERSSRISFESQYKEE